MTFSGPSPDVNTNIIRSSEWNATTLQFDKTFKICKNAGCP